ncbi:hypothetical protein C8J56DRAFT_1062697 [Mycena floridula]|nr:hypothetical protein C8J56DRAFT_1062697 [Mycena floridula]
MDGNSRMKSRLRANAQLDLPLGGGMGYQVEDGEYREHLKIYVSEEDISSCLRSSGVGGCVCTRHELMRPLGLDDLQKGEQYSNMDFVFFSSILDTCLHDIFLTYDIACQYTIALESRNQLLPAKLYHDFAATKIQGALPIWHGDIHILKCWSQKLVQYQRGAGKTDGKAPERVWAETNKTAYVTKEMGVETRHDAIEDRLDHHNHEKNVKMGAMLEQKLKLALVEERKQALKFEQVNETLEAKVQELWEGMFEAWYQNRETAMTPFAPMVEDGVTEAEVRLQLKKEDAEEARRNKTDINTKSPTSFVMLGLELEDSQRRLKADLVSVSKMTTSELAKVEDRRRRLYGKLKTFRWWQEVFMPAGIKAVMDEEEKRDANALPPKAEDIKLWLSSNIPAIHH